MGEKRAFGAVAVDLGASSGRYAAGWLEEGRIEFEVVEQARHAPVERGGPACWDLDFLLGLCRGAAECAGERFERSTVGIDSWGVDHGFLDAEGRLLQAPVAYRDVSHVAAFEELAPRRRELYAWTGIQHQPFNTVVQLYARAKEHPDWPGRTSWMILPDLLGYLLCGAKGHELTQASTAQLMGLDCRWSEEAFGVAGWPAPEVQPSLPGVVAGRLGERVELARVASHDTASAVAGLGLEPGDAFLNVGTWSLLGAVIDQPIATREAEDLKWTNERAHDGRVRFLKNIPGFWIVNGLYDELGIEGGVPAWLAGADPAFSGRFDCFDMSLYAPDSMVQACRALMEVPPKNPAEWAAAALGSLIDATAPQPAELERLTGQRFKRIRAAGGGSQCRPFCQALADRSGLPVVAGPVEATVLGNLVMQFVAQGVVSLEDVGALVRRSMSVSEFSPMGQ